MRHAQLLQEIRVGGAPFAGRLLMETRNRELAQHSDPGGPDANHGDHQVLAIDLDPDTRPDGEPFLEISGDHCNATDWSYQRMMWNGGFHSGPRNFTSASTDRRRSENCPSERRTRAVARKVASVL